ncbi:Uncharacterised protein [uncultured archaeon]|nr:Uncharacterised protein [uncultured archaeon]
MDEPNSKEWSLIIISSMMGVMLSKGMPDNPKLTGIELLDFLIALFVFAMIFSLILVIFLKGVNYLFPDEKDVK